MCGGPTTKDSTPPSDTGTPTNSHNKDSSSKELSNTPLPIHMALAIDLWSVLFAVLCVWKPSTIVLPVVGTQLFERYRAEHVEVEKPVFVWNICL